MIKTLEDAKRYFKSMGCSHFHLDRANRDIAEEYYKLNISRELEEQWREEEIIRQLDEFPFETPKDIGFAYIGLCNLIDRRKKKDLDRVLTLTKKIVPDIHLSQIGSILSPLIGSNSSPTHGGLIALANVSGYKNISMEFINLAKILIKKADESNIRIMWSRGYLADVIEKLKIQEDEEYLHFLRENDYRDSFDYYKSGASGGNVFSMRMLASFYKDGKGCEADLKQAIHWLELAAESGNELAIKDLNEIKATVNQSGENKE